MIIRLTTFAAAAWLILRWDQRRRAREQQLSTTTKPADVSTWEGEGGALPTVGPQLGPPPSRLHATQSSVEDETADPVGRPPR